MSVSIIKIIDKFLTEQQFTYQSFEVKGFICYKILPLDLIPLLEFLKNNQEMRFTVLTDLFAADFPERNKRFEIVYSLLSLKINQRILIKLEVSEEERLASACQVYSAACWYEREIFDMFGVMFGGSPDLRRILTDYGFEGHPLRKDFPLTGYVQVKYDEGCGEVVYEPVLLEQEFRNFDFASAWQGPRPYALPGDEKAT